MFQTNVWKNLCSKKWQAFSTACAPATIIYYAEYIAAQVQNMPLSLQVVDQQLLQKNTSNKIFILHKKFTSLHKDPTLFLQIRAMSHAALAADAALPNYARYEPNARHGSSATHAAHGLYGTNATHATHTIDIYVAAFSTDSDYESNGSSTSTVLTNEPLYRESSGCILSGIRLKDGPTFSARTPELIVQCNGYFLQAKEVEIHVF